MRDDIDLWSSFIPRVSITMFSVAHNQRKSNNIKQKSRKKYYQFQIVHCIS